MKSKQFPVSKPRYGNLWYDNKIIMSKRAFPILQAENGDCLLLDVIKRTL